MFILLLFHNLIDKLHLKLIKIVKIIILENKPESIFVGFKIANAETDGFVYPLQLTRSFLQNNVK